MAELVKDKQKLQEILLHHVATADQGEYESSSRAAKLQSDLQKAAGCGTTSTWRLLAVAS